MKDTTPIERKDSQVSTETHEVSPGDAEVLDYDALIERCMGNLNLAHRLLERCQTHLPQEIDEVEKALEQQDADQVACLAHRLKGATATILAQGMNQVAEEIERCGHRGCLADIPPQMERLRREWDRFRQYVGSLLEQTNSL
jgi:HPt (histidine-containing phosphotransfer) domain-containing protein